MDRIYPSACSLSETTNIKNTLLNMSCQFNLNISSHMHEIGEIKAHCKYV